MTPEENDLLQIMILGWEKGYLKTKPTKENFQKLIVEYLNSPDEEDENESVATPTNEQ